MLGKTLSIILWFCANVVLFAQNHTFQPEMGSSIYFNNNQKYEIPNEASFKFKPAESFFIGFTYQRRINDILYFKTGLYHTSISQRYSHEYRWELTDTKFINDKIKENFWILSMACIKIPVGLTLHMPLNKKRTHTLETSVGLNCAYIFTSAASSSSAYWNEDFSKQTPTFYYYRETTFPLQLFAEIRFTYIHTTPKNRNWVFFFDFNPQITRNTIYTEITLMPGSPTQKTWAPYISNHHVQFGVGYRFVKRNRIAVARRL